MRAALASSSFSFPHMGSETTLKAGIAGLDSFSAQRCERAVLAQALRHSTDEEGGEMLPPRWSDSEMHCIGDWSDSEPLFAVLPVVRVSVQS